MRSGNALVSNLLEVFEIVDANDADNRVMEATVDAMVEGLTLRAQITKMILRSLKNPTWMISGLNADLFVIDSDPR